MTNPLVSVIIPTYNGSQWLGSTIQSALHQTYTPIEIIVIDDGSTDDSPSVVASFGDKVRYKRQENAGTPAARNTGIRHANGTLIALLDHDDRWLPNKLIRQVPLFDDPVVGLVHAGARIIDQASKRTTSEVIPDPELDEQAILSWCKVSCASTIFRKNIVDSLGGFDETLPGADDWDMWIRIALAGWRIAAVPEILAEIHEHPGNQGKKVDRMNRMALAVIEKHCSQQTVHPVRLKALRSARARLREDYYVKTCLCAAHAQQQRRWIMALALRLKALLHHPDAVRRFPQRLKARLHHAV